MGEKEGRFIETVENPNQLINRIFSVLDVELPEYLSPAFRMTLPQEDEIDHTKFTRGYLNYKGMDVTISIFTAAQHDIVSETEDVLGVKKPGDMTLEQRFEAGIALPGDKSEDLYKQKTGPEDFPMPTMPVTFEHDYRTSNPGLHKLYVGYALETILVTKKCVDDLFAMSRWPASHMAQLLWSEVGRTVVSDAAWWDAMALIGARIDLEPYLPNPRSLDSLPENEA